MTMTSATPKQRPLSVPGWCGLLMLLILLCPVSSLAQPSQSGIIRDTALRENWIIIDSHRLLITPQTVIKNFTIGSNSPSALQKGRFVYFNASPQHELVEIWVYKENPRPDKH
jgi:hypothetical protein